MAVKEWTSKFATGVGIDDVATGGMETLVNSADDTRVSQIHAVRDSVIAMEKQAWGAPWFEWDKTTLGQFDTPIEGVDIDGVGSNVSVVSFAGVSWIEIQLNTSGAGDTLSTGIFLPITAAPPGTDHMLAYDFVCTNLGGGSTVGAGIFLRKEAADTMYTMLHRTTGTNALRRERWNAGVSTQIGPDQPGSVLSANDDGGRLGFAARGAGTESMVSQMEPSGFVAHTVDPAPLLTAPASGAGVFCSSLGNNQTVTLLIRNLRGYTLVS